MANQRGKSRLGIDIAMFVVSMLAIGGCAKPLPPIPPAVLPAETTLAAPVLAESDRPLILIYHDSLNSLPTSRQGQVDVAVWGNGRMVWRVGRALVQGRVETQKIDELLQRLHQEGVFGDGHTYYGNIGPGANFVVIDIRLPDRSLKLSSWHETYDQNPRVVVTSYGVESRQGRDVESVLALDMPDYQRFRKIWSEIRSAIKSWESLEHDPFVGEILIDG